MFTPCASSFMHIHAMIQSILIEFEHADKIAGPISSIHSVKNVLGVRSNEKRVETVKSKAR
jgi:hypothetical protein